MFSAIRNNIGYQNVASLMRQRGIRYETTDVIDMIGARPCMARLAAQRLSSAR